MKRYRNRSQIGFVCAAVSVCTAMAVISVVMACVLMKRRHPMTPGSGIAVSCSDKVKSQSDMATSTAEGLSSGSVPAAGPMREVDRRLGEALDKISRSYGASAVQVAIIQNGTVCGYYNFGSADKSGKAAVTADTAFRAASLSKLVDAMAVMKLSEQGRFDIDADIGEYMGYRVRTRNYPKTPITPRMLMTHTSSMKDSSGFLASRNSGSSTPLKNLLSQSSSYSGSRPGSAYRYSNFGVALLAAAAEKQAGQPFYEYTEKALFQPLGINGSFLASRIADKNQVACLYNTRGRLSYGQKRQLDEKCSEKLGQTHHIYQGNITISAADYAALMCVLLNDGVGGNGERILSSESTQEILEVQYESDDTRSCLCNFISGRIVKGRTMHYHTGSNFGMYSSFAFDTADRSGVVVLTSGASAKKERSGVYNICGDIIRKIYDECQPNPISR